MKSLKRNLVLTTVLGIAIMVGLSGSVSATPILTFGANNTDANATTTPDTTNTDGEGTAVNDTTNTANETANTTAGNVTFTTTNTNANRVTVNNVDTNKDLPQTGENDIYIVTAIGAVALAIGGVAYMKSRKYNI